MADLFSKNLTPKRRSVLEKIAKGGPQDLMAFDPRVVSALIWNKWVEVVFFTPDEAGNNSGLARGGYGQISTLGDVSVAEIEEAREKNQVLVPVPIKYRITDLGREQLAIGYAA